MSFVQKIDLLSPRITLYFKGQYKHSSIFSGILTLISFVLILASGIYYLLTFINKNSPKAYFFTRYIDDAGYFPVNASSMFNYVQFVNKYEETKFGFDFRVIRAFGVDKIYSDQYMNNPEVIVNENHWIYGPCNLDSDIKGIEDLIDHDVYDNAACIREYYDKAKKRYFKTGEQGFRWPTIEKGCSNPARTFYGIIVQRCDKVPNSLLRDYLGECGTEELITETLKNISLKYEILDHYADMLNYEMPFTKYFYEVTSAVQDGIYIVNHLNFNPANMLTHNGFFFDNIEEEKSYFFTQNEKHTIDQSILLEGESTNGCLIGIYFWMQNTLQQYERNYDRVQDLLSDIGGIGSIITTFAYYINFLINYYITLLDTEELVINRDEVNYGNIRKNTVKPTILKRPNQMNNPPRRQMRPRKDVYVQKRKKEEDMYHPNEIKNDRVDIYNTNYKLMPNFKSERINMNNTKKNQREKIDDNNSNNNTYIENEKKENVKYCENNENNENSEKYMNNYIEQPRIQKQNFNCCKYFMYMISCKTNDKMIEYYEKIRENIISEENIIQNYIDVYQLLKINGLPKKDIFIRKQ